MKRDRLSAMTPSNSASLAQEALMRPGAKRKGGRGRATPGRGPRRSQKKRRP